MFNSIQTKILFFISIIFISTTISTLYFTTKDVKKAVLKTEIKNIENIQNIIHLNVEGKYKNLLLDKGISIIKRKEKIKNELKIIEKAIIRLDFLKKGETYPSKKEEIIKWIESLNLSSDIFLADKDNNIFFSTNSMVEKLNLNAINDVKRRPLSKGINRKNSTFERYSVFSWNKNSPKKISYIKYLGELNWVLGVTTNIDEIQKESEKKTAQIIRVLKENFARIKIAETGTLFLFDKNNKILIPPSPESKIHIDPSLIEKLKNLKENESLNIKITDKEFNCYTSKIKALSWYISYLVPVNEIKKPAYLLSKRLSFLISGIFITGLLLLIIAVKKFSNPLKKLTLKLKTIPEQDLTSPELSNYLSSEFSTTRKDEVGSLTKAFLFMFSQLQENIKMLIKTTADKERIEGELNVARDIQLGILPKIFPPFPDKKEVDIYAYLKPAKEVGGDLYDFFLIDDNNLCFVVGDVSDKGVPAALFMAITKTLIKTNAEKKISPADIMSKVNDVLSKDNPNCMFVTLIIGILNLETGEIKYANAGHNPPVIKESNKIYFKKGISGPVAGAVENIDYRELSLTLGKDDMIFLYTDGVTEAMDISNNLFSDEELLKLLTENSFDSAKEYIKLVKKEVSVFSTGAPQSDDITILSVIYRG